MNSNNTTSNIIDDIADEEFDRMLDEHFSNDHSIRKGFAQIGRPYTIETRKKISDSRIGKKLSQEHIESIKTSLQGRIFSQEHKDKIKIANTGKKRKPGKVLSEETKIKIKQSKIGKPRNEETKKQISKTKSTPIMTDDGIMQSCKEASLFYNVDVSTIRNWLKNKNKTNFYKL